MDVPQLSPQLIDALRTWFHPKDRSVYLAPSTFAYLPGGIGYLSMAFISETILTASATSVTFSNIPQDFRTLLLISRLRSDAGANVDGAMVRFNGDSGANYDIEYLQANGGTASAVASRATATTATLLAEGTTARANTFSANIILVPGYTVASTEKKAITLAEGMGDASVDTVQFLRVGAVRWRNLNVITSVSILPQVGPNFVSGSRFQLYGVL